MSVILLSYSLFNLGNVQTPLEELIEAEIESEAWSIPEKHACVAPREAHQPLILVDLSNLLSIGHCLVYPHLRPGL